MRISIGTPPLIPMRSPSLALQSINQSAVAELVSSVPEMLNFDTKLYISRYSKTNQVKISTKHEFLKPMNKTNFLTHTSLKIANLI